MGMLSAEHRSYLDKTVDEGDPFAIKEAVEVIRESLNPHPAGQKTLNAPKKEELTGVQHKYSETVLFFAAAAQTCHAYCTYAAPRDEPTASGAQKFGTLGDTTTLSTLTLLPFPFALAGTASAGRSSSATPTCASRKRTLAPSSIISPTTRR